MLAHLSLSKYPKGLFVWIAVEDANASAKPFNSTRNTSRTHEAAKEGAFGAKNVFFYP